MARYRDDLPQLAGGLFLTDGGLETDLIFHRGLELPYFAAFVLLETGAGRQTLKDYYRSFMDLARREGVGFVLESMTWRASGDWGGRLGYSATQLHDFNRAGIALLAELREEYDDMIPSLPISGCMGPRGQGYVADLMMSSEEAADYHRAQIAAFRQSEADLATAFTLPCVAEAVGIAQAARAEAMPVVIGFTVETDGRLPSGQSLEAAVMAVEDATDGYPAYYMVNCAHPSHFENVLDGLWTGRVRAVRSNASTKSHAELDESEELDEGDPKNLATAYRALAAKLANLNVVGGCCGTDCRHVAEICKALRPSV